MMIIFLLLIVAISFIDIINSKKFKKHKSNKFDLKLNFKIISKGNIRHQTRQDPIQVSPDPSLVVVPVPPPQPPQPTQAPQPAPAPQPTQSLPTPANPPQIINTPQVTITDCKVTNSTEKTIDASKNNENITINYTVTTYNTTDSKNSNADNITIVHVINITTIHYIDLPSNDTVKNNTTMDTHIINNTLTKNIIIDTPNVDNPAAIAEDVYPL